MRKHIISYIVSKEKEKMFVNIFFLVCSYVWNVKSRQKNLETEGMSWQRLAGLKEVKFEDFRWIS